MAVGPIKRPKPIRGAASGIAWEHLRYDPVGIGDGGNGGGGSTGGGGGPGSGNGGSGSGEPGLGIGAKGSGVPTAVAPGMHGSLSALKGIAGGIIDPISRRRTTAASSR